MPLPIWQIPACLDPPTQLQVDRPGEGERRHESCSLSSPSPSLDILEATPCPQVPLETLAVLSAKGGEGDLKSARECQREEKSRAEGMENILCDPSHSSPALAVLPDCGRPASYWLPALTPSSTGRVTLDKPFLLSRPRFPHL